MKRIIQVFLSGGFDGLTGFPRVDDPDYDWASDPHEVKADEALPLADGFYVHQNFPLFKEVFDDGDAILYAAIATDHRQMDHKKAHDVARMGMDNDKKSSSDGSGTFGRAIEMLEGTQDYIQAFSIDNIISPSIKNRDINVGAISGKFNFIEDKKIVENYVNMVQGLSDIDSEDLRVALETEELANSIDTSSKAALIIELLKATEAKVITYNIGGWDHHTNVKNNVANKLKREVEPFFRELVDGLKKENLWDDTVIVVLSEFGRRVAINNAQGREHGIAGPYLVMGGDVNGGRIGDNWPGLTPEDLVNGSIRQVTDARSVIGGIIHQSFGLTKEETKWLFETQDVFPIFDDILGEEVIQPLPFKVYIYQFEFDEFIEIDNNFIKIPASEAKDITIDVDEPDNGIAPPVEFSIPSLSLTHVENREPYRLVGDNVPFTFPVGTHKVTITDEVRAQVVTIEVFDDGSQDGNKQAILQELGEIESAVDEIKNLID